MSGYVGIVCSVAFLCSAVYLVQRYRKENAYDRWVLPFPFAPLVLAGQFSFETE